MLISHLHFDHLHIPSLRLLPHDTTLIVPLGAGSLLRGRGFTDVRETRAGETTRLGSVDVQTVPARHSARRGPHTRITARAVGYVLRSSGRTVYFAGDTDLFAEMAELAPVDVALLPIWGWGPKLGPGHLDPRTAAEAAALLDAGVVVPIHWGTYSPSILRNRPPSWLTEPVDRFGVELDRIGLGDRVRVLAPGERLVLPGDVRSSPSARRSRPCRTSAVTATPAVPQPARPRPQEPPGHGRRRVPQLAHVRDEGPISEREFEASVKRSSLRSDATAGRVFTYGPHTTLGRAGSSNVRRHDLQTLRGGVCEPTSSKGCLEVRTRLHLPEPSSHDTVEVPGSSPVVPTKCLLEGVGPSALSGA